MADIASKVKKLSKSYKSISSPVFVKTGSVVFDAMLGGGIPEGSFIVWSSGAGIGKSTGSLYICMSFCLQGKRCLYLDFEGGVNQNQLEGIGLDRYKWDEKDNPDGTFYVFQVNTFADAEAFLDDLIEDIDLIVLDSVTAILPSKMKEKSVEDINPGLHARLTSAFLQKYKATSKANGTSWIMINQLRTHIRFVGMTTEEEAGGLGLKFYSDYRIMMKEAKNGKMKRKEETTQGIIEVPYGSINEIWCIKSRYTRPFIPLKIAMVFGKGISNIHAYRDFLDYKGCIKKSGAWYEIDFMGTKAKMQGDNKVIDWVRENKDQVRAFIADGGGYSLVVNEAVPFAEESESQEKVYDYDTDPNDYDGDGNYINIATGDIDE